jgi:uncharacterized protein (TIRG00374 family)
MPISSKKRILSFGIAVGGVLAILIIRKADVRQSWATLSQIDPKLLALALLVTGINYPLRAWRWKFIFPPGWEPDFWVCFQVMAIGIACNNFLPARSGDIARCTLVSRKLSLSTGSLGLGTLGVEKVLDGLMVVAILFISFWFVTPPHWLSRALVLAAMVFAAGLFLLLLLHAESTGWAVDLCGAALRTLHLDALGDQLKVLLASFRQGVRTVTSPLRMALLSLLTVGIWASEGALVWALAAPLHVSLSFLAACLVSAVLGLGLMIPAAPGSVGTYEFFAVAGLQLVAVNVSRALVVALLLHTWVFAVTSVIGLVCLAPAGISLLQLSESQSGR